MKGTLALREGFSRRRCSGVFGHNHQFATDTEVTEDLAGVFADGIVTDTEKYRDFGSGLSHRDKVQYLRLPLSQTELNKRLPIGVLILFAQILGHPLNYPVKYAADT
jgi:hypothetical protein